MHTSVLLTESIEALDIKDGGHYIDGTAGEGGHSRAIAARGGNVLAIDIDQDQISNLEKVLVDPKVTLARGNYADIAQIAQTHGFAPADGIIIDLGLSMRQLKTSGKGLSYHADHDPLDMRLGESDLTAADLLNRETVENLYDLFAKYSEEIHSFEISRAVVRHRVQKKFAVVSDLITAIDQGLSMTAVPADADKTKTYSRIFQALRIAVNDEFGNIKAALAGGMEILKPGGRMVMITFHSLEDRLVKQFIVKNNIKALNKKPARGNPELKFERSAKMRVLIKE